MKFKHIIIFYIFFIPCKIFAQSTQSDFLFDKNILQIDPFLLDYQIIKSSNQIYNENNIQFVTTRPSFSFYFNLDNIIVRPTLSINPSLSSSQGSFALGKLYDKFFEFGGYSLLNHTESEIGTGISNNGVVRSQFLLGPYIVLYPFVSEQNVIQIYGRIAYAYSEYKTTLSGVTTNVSEQKGVNLNFSAQYSRKLNDKFYYSPNINFTYFLTSDFGGQNTVRNGYELQLIPLSIQMVL